MQRRSLPALLSLFSGFLASTALGGVIDTTFGDCLKAELAAASRGGNSFYSSPEGKSFLAPFRQRYRVQVEGLDGILARGNQKILILGNHPSASEPAVTLDALGSTALNPSPVLAEEVLKIPLLGAKFRSIAERLNAI